MKNVFARTVLALVLIPSFWMTSVGTAAAGGWVDTPGETVGKMINCFYYTSCTGGGTPVSFTVLGYYQACLDAKPEQKKQGHKNKDGSDPYNLLDARSHKYADKNDWIYWVMTNPYVPKENHIRYMQFVPEYEGALAGLCYYYEAGSSSGAGGDYTWRWDE